VSLEELRCASDFAGVRSPFSGDDDLLGLEVESPLTAGMINAAPTTAMATPNDLRPPALLRACCCSRISPFI